MDGTTDEGFMTPAKQQPKSKELGTMSYVDAENRDILCLTEYGNLYLIGQGREERIAENVSNRECYRLMKEIMNGDGHIRSFFANKIERARQIVPTIF